MSRTWIKLHHTYMSPESTVADVADVIGLNAYAYWPAILSRAGQGEGGPGVIHTTARGFARSLRHQATPDELEWTWQAFIDAGLISVEGDMRNGSPMVVTVQRWSEVQRLTSGERMALKRARDADDEACDSDNTFVTQRHIVLSNEKGEQERREDVTSLVPSSLRSSGPIDSTPTGGLGERTVPDERDLALSRRRKISGLTDDDLEARIANCRSVLGEGLADAVTELVKAAAGTNKSGQMALSKAYREFYEPLARTVRQLNGDHRRGREAVEHGVVVAMSGGKVESSRYAQAVAVKWQPGEALRSLPSAEISSLDAVEAMYGESV